MTEKHYSVNPLIPARIGQTTTNYEPVMNTKVLALISGILATAFGQIKNVLTKGADEPDSPPDEPAAPAKKAAKKAPPVVEEEPEEDAADDDITVVVEEEEAPDAEELKKKAKKLVAQLFGADDGNKKKVKAALTALGEENIGDMDDDNLPKFIKALQKLGAK